MEEMIAFIGWFQIWTKYVRDLLAAVHCLPLIHEHESTL
jgi:hypothetical protein